MASRHKTLVARLFCWEWPLSCQFIRRSLPQKLIRQKPPRLLSSGATGFAAMSAGTDTRLMVCRRCGAYSAAKPGVCHGSCRLRGLHLRRGGSGRSNYLSGPYHLRAVDRMTPPKARRSFKSDPYAKGRFGNLAGRGPYDDDGRSGSRYRGDQAGLAAMTEDKPLHRHDFPWHLMLATRWADNDQYGHVSTT